MSELGFEGFDHGNDYHLSEEEEKKENWAQAKIWVVLAILFGLCLGLTIYLSAKDLFLMINGKSVETEYKKGESNVNIYDEAGNKYYVYIGDTIISPKGNTLKVYYYDNDMRNAKAMTALWFWLIMYGLWLPLFLICIRCIYKNLHPYKIPVKKE